MKNPAPLILLILLVVGALYFLNPGPNDKPLQQELAQSQEVEQEQESSASNLRQIATAEPRPLYEETPASQPLKGENNSYFTETQISQINALAESYANDRSLSVASVLGTWGEFIDTLDLSPDERQALIDLMSEAQEKNISLLPLYMSGQISDEDYLELSAENRLDTVLENFLNEDELEEFYIYQAERPARLKKRMAETNYNMLTMNAPDLREENRQLVAEAMADETANARRYVEMIEMENQENQENQEVVSFLSDPVRERMNAAVLKKMESVLDEQQYAALKRYYVEERARREMMNQFFQDNAENPGFVR